MLMLHLHQNSHPKVLIESILWAELYVESQMWTSIIKPNFELTSYYVHPVRWKYYNYCNISLIYQQSNYSLLSFASIFKEETTSSAQIL